MAFRLRNLLGFQPRLAPELGYGKAVHHVHARRRRAHQGDRPRADTRPRSTRSSTRASSCRPRTSRRTGSSRTPPGGSSRPTRTKHEDDLHRVWETERPFELHLDGVTVSGRADVILDQEGGVPTALAIVDYKTSTTGEIADHALQLQVYADAGRREGLDVRAAYVHDLKAAARDPIACRRRRRSPAPRRSWPRRPTRIRARDYAPNPGVRCRALRGADDLRVARKR